MKCTICGLEIKTDSDGIWSGGHNAEPINEGRCCEKCNDIIVLPMRLREFTRRNKDANT